MKNLKKQWQFIWTFAKNDFKSRYSSSQLGIFWAFCRPVVMALVYIFVFTVVARASTLDSGYPYALWLLPGLVAWFVISEAITSATTALADYSYLVKKVNFDVEYLPRIKTVSAFIVHGFFVMLILFIYLLWGMPVKWEMLQILYYILCTFCITAAIGKITCAIYPFFKDITALNEIILMILMWGTPVMWSIDILPDNFVSLFKLNPFFYLVEGYRQAFMGTGWLWNDLWMGLYFWIVTICLTWLGNKFFKKLSVHFADLI
mgnify:CR=1 FL=1